MALAAVLFKKVRRSRGVMRASLMRRLGSASANRAREWLLKVLAAGRRRNSPTRTSALPGREPSGRSNCDGRDRPANLSGRQDQDEHLIEPIRAIQDAPDVGNFFPVR